MAGEARIAQDRGGLAVAGGPAPHPDGLPGPVRRAVSTHERADRSSEEPLKLHTKLGASEGAQGTAQELLELVGLEARPAARRERAQRWRAAARRDRAFARAPPRILVPDEPPSSLDLSVRRSIIDLLGDPRRELELANC